MSEKASSIIGHRRSEAGTNLTPPEEAPAASRPAVPGAPDNVRPAASFPSAGTCPSQARPAARPRYQKGEKSSLSKLFSFSGRMGQGAYFVLVLIYNLYFYSFIAFPDGADNKYYGLWLLLLPLFAWIRIAGNTRRCHDFGRSGWWQVVPFFVLWMLFSPGDAFPNEYDD